VSDNITLPRADAEQIWDVLREFVRDSATTSEIESDLDDAIKARQAAEKAWDARVIKGNRWDEGWVRAQELDRLKTQVADLNGELRKAQQKQQEFLDKIHAILKQANEVKP
jgi:hypothetical protein